MIRVMNACLFCVLTAGATAYAADATPPSTPSSREASGTPSEMNAQYKQMQDQMNAMMAEMQKLQSTADPSARQQIMQQHMASMAAFMDSMKDSCCGTGTGMMGAGTMHGPMMSGSQAGAGTSANTDVVARLNALDQRLNLLTQAVDQLVKHQQAAQKKQ